MPTNEERREVARKLRGEKCGFAGWVGAVYIALEVDGETAGCDMLDLLADLIEPEPERTGTPVLDDQGWRMWRCPECGQPINRADNYCSSCGVKVTPTPL